MNKIEIVTSVGFSFHMLRRCTVQKALKKKKECKASEMPGTTHQMTQHRIPEGWMEPSLFTLVS
jgi:hypothetical protein